MIITIRDEQPNGLFAQVWKFWFYDHRRALVLDEYREESRATKRHGWKTYLAYNRLNRHESSLRDDKDVPMTEELKARALTAFTSELTVKVWSEIR